MSFFMLPRAAANACASLIAARYICRAQAPHADDAAASRCRDDKDEAPRVYIAGRLDFDVHKIFAVAAFLPLATILDAMISLRDEESA